MTLPHERVRSLHAARRLLFDLLDPKATPRVPRDVRRYASRVLKHYPADHEIETLATSGLDAFDAQEHARKWTRSLAFHLKDQTAE